MSIIQRVTGAFTRHRDKVMHFVVGVILGVVGSAVGLVLAVTVGGGLWVLFGMPIAMTTVAAVWKEQRDPDHGGTQDAMDIFWTVAGCVAVLLPLAAVMAVILWA